jgi:hypothetical protein
MNQIVLSFREKPIRTAIIAMFSSAVFQASAQSTAEMTKNSTATSNDQVETLEVTGRAMSIKKAIAEKRMEKVVSDGVSANEIGSIPDFGLGEALERVAGVSMVINNARGEAQYMTTRGFNPDYNTLTIDGVALPGTETTRRVVSLDVIPSSLARQVTVFKTYTPEMDGNVVGGLTNVQTRSAFDKPGFHSTIRGDLSQWTSEPRLRSGSPSGEFDATVSNTFGDKNQFGLLVSGSYFRRDSSSLNTAIDSYSYFAKSGAQTLGAKLNPATTDVSSALVFPDRLRWLTYDNVRTRTSLFAKLDYNNDAGFTAHVSGGSFEHNNDEHRHSHWLQSATTTTNSITVNPESGNVSNGQSQTDYAMALQKRKLNFIEVGGNYIVSEASEVDFTVNKAQGSFRQDSLFYTFAQANGTGLAYDYTYKQGGIPVFIPKNSTQLFDATRYTMTGTNGPRDEQSNTDQLVAKVDFSHNFKETSKGFGYKFGSQFRDVTKGYNYNEGFYNPATGTTTTLAQVGVNPTSVIPYSSGSNLPLLLIDQNTANIYTSANPSRYVLAPASVTNSLQRDFQLKERVSSAYALGAYQTENSNIIAGVRAEQTNTAIKTSIAEPLNQTSLFKPYEKSSDRTDLLPSINATLDLSDTFRLRAGSSLSIARPTYAQLAQNSNTVAGSTISTTLANPELKPRSAQNLDFSLEWYLNRNQALTLGLFKKRLRDEIANLTTTTNLSIGSSQFVQNITQAQNVGTAEVTGAELTYTQVKFNFLPAPFNDFGVSGNFTVLDQSAASIVMQDKSIRQLPGLQDAPNMIGNLSLLWGNGPWNGQIAYKRIGKSMYAASSSSAAQDVFLAPAKTVDAQFNYKIGNGASLVFSAKNLTNQWSERRISGPASNLILQETYNGKSYWIGASWSM